MREREEARCSGRADGEKERGREEKSDGGRENRRLEKLMSRLLCDGACLFHCQAAFLHTHLKNSALLPVFSFFLFLFSSFLSQFLALSLGDFNSVTSLA